MTGASWEQRVLGLAELVGRPVVDDASPHVEYATSDSIRHFARAYGDGNPLYSDPAYAAKGPRRALVAPPLFPIATGTPLPVPGGDLPAVDIGASIDGGEPSVVSDAWTLIQPIVAGTRLERSTWLQAVERGPAGADVTIRRRYTAAGVVYATQDRTRRYGAAASVAASARLSRAVYTASELVEIDSGYDRHSRRGARPRWVDDVGVGDRLGPMVKGPLTITDLVEYRAGVGPGPLGASALDLARLQRGERPGLYSVDASNVPDTVERRHWDEDYARSLGHPTVYDYSHTRLTWFSHLLTDWIGDGGWLRYLSASTTANNYLGDTHRIEGTVVAVGEERRDRVRIELLGRNQRHEVTCTGVAVVLLPLRPADLADVE
jgi:acyl dehydratase